MPPDAASRQPLQSVMRAHADAVTRRLDALLPPVGGPQRPVVEAMRYAALSGGKRLRPFLALETAALFGLGEDDAIDCAAAIEMVHCYSLIHDDLPAMDDSALRRGRATVHVAFDEATAILAGDALLTEAFAVLAAPRCHPDPAVRTALVAGLAAASGAAGMVGGQMIDLSPERDALDLDGITALQRLKTGALIGFACEAGAILGRAEAPARAALRAYAADLGLAFQIVDDLLDAESTPEELGKPTGQDHVAGKATFVGLLGKEAARDRARSLVAGATDHLAPFGRRAHRLAEVAGFVLERRW